MERPTDLPKFDTRPYIAVSDSMPDSPKIIGLSDEAFRALITTWCWCNKQKTNGRVPKAAMRQWRPKTIKELVTAGVLESSGDVYLCHDYLSHQRSAEEIAMIRDAQSSGGSKGAHVRWHVSRRRRDPGCEWCLKEVSAHG